MKKWQQCVEEAARHISKSNVDVSNSNELGIPFMITPNVKDLWKYKDENLVLTDNRVKILIIAKEMRMSNT